MTKRLLSTVLAIAMVMSVFTGFSIPALAIPTYTGTGTALDPYMVDTADELQAVMALKDNATNHIMLSDDIITDSRIALSEQHNPMVLDLNGKTLEFTGGALLDLYNKATVRTGNVLSEHVDAVCIYEESVTLEYLNISSAQMGGVFIGSGNATIKNCALTGADFALFVSGGTATVADTTMYGGSHAYYIDSHGTATVDGETVTGTAAQTTYPTLSAPSEITVYFTNNKRWQTPQIVFDTVKFSMNSAGTNPYGEDIFSYTFDSASVDINKISFADGADSNNTTAYATGVADYAGYYCLDTKSDGTSYDLAGYIHTPTYIIWGNAALCGSAWDATDTNNQMTLDGSVYKKVYTDVAVLDDYRFKVIEDGQKYFGEAGGGAVRFNVNSVCDVTVTFNPATKQINVTGSGVEYPIVSFEAEAVLAVGNGSGNWLNGVPWDPASNLNRMTEISPDVYQIKYQDVAKGNTYELVFAANYGWSDYWGGTFSASGAETDAVHNGGNITFDVTYDLADITATLDLSAFDYATKAGAKFTVTIEEAAGTVPPTLYDLWVGGVQVTSENASAITGSGITGTVSYNAATKTLTLNNATITEPSYDMYGDPNGIIANSDLTIDIIGQNTIDVDGDSGSYGIYCYEGLAFTNSTGDPNAKLRIEADSCAVTTSTHLTDTGFTVKGSLSISDPLEVITSQGAYRIGTDNVKVLELTAYSGPTFYDLWVGGVQVTSDNASAITGSGISGTVSYNAATKTLTLKNATITGAFYDGYFNYGILSVDALTVDLIGNNTVDADGYSDCVGIYGNDALTFTNSTGEGSGLRVESSIVAVAGNPITDTEFSVKGAASLGDNLKDIINNGREYLIDDSNYGAIRAVVAELTALPPDYTLYLSGGVIRKNGQNGDIITVPGISWEDSGNRWVFNNVLFETTANVAVHIEPDAEELKLIGGNAVRSNYGGAGISIGLHIFVRDLTVTGDGDLSVYSGNAEGSTGISSQNVIFEGSGSLTGWSGNADGSGWDIDSTGFFATGLSVTGTGTVTGRAGEATGIGNSYGVSILTGQLTVTDGSVTGYGHTCGIYTSNAPVITGMEVTGSDYHDGLNAAVISDWNGKNSSKKWIHIEKTAAVPTHTHKVCVDGLNCTADGSACSHGDITFITWDQAVADGLITSNSYFYLLKGTAVGNRYELNIYLDKDITLDKYFLVYENTDVSLCLNGHTLTVNGTKIIEVGGSNYDNAGFALTDCGTAGKVTGGTTYAPVEVSGGVFTMYGGSITGNTNRAVYIQRYGSSYTAKAIILGGTISDNSTTSSDGGGAIYLQTGDLVIAGDAVISGNSALMATYTTNGGAIYVKPYAGNVSLHIGGNAQIINNTASGFGGAMYLTSMSSGAYDSFTISGNAKINNNTAAYGGAIAVDSTALTISDSVEITGNRTTNGKFLSSYYGALTYSTSGANLTITDNVRICDNYIGDTSSTEQANLSVRLGNVIDLTGLGTGAKLGIYRMSDKLPDAATPAIDISAANAPAGSEALVSADIDGYKVVNTSGVLQMVEKPVPVSTDYTIYLAKGEIRKNNVSGDIITDNLGITVSGDATNGWVYTFTNVDFATTAIKAVQFGDTEATLMLSGDNSLTGGEGTGSGYGVYINGSITIDGTGTLTVVGGNAASSCYGIYAGNNITVKGGKISATAGNSQNENSFGVYSYESLNVEGGELIGQGGTASSYSEGVYSGNTLKVSGGTVIGIADNTPGAAYESFGVESFGTLTVTGGTVTGIGKDYGIYSGKAPLVIGMILTAGDNEDGSNAAVISDWTGRNCDKIWMRIEEPAQPMAPDYTIHLENGKVYHDHRFGAEIDGADYGITISGNSTSGWVYTFTDVNFTTTASCAVSFGDSNGATMMLVGDNNLACGNSTDDSTSAIEAEKITIDGTGTLNVTAGNSTQHSSYGIFANYLTVKGGTITAVAGNGLLDSEGIYAYKDMTVEGGYIKGESGLGVFNAGIYVMGEGLTVTDGTVIGIGKYMGIYSNKAPQITGMDVWGTNNEDGSGATVITDWNGENGNMWMKIEKKVITNYDLWVGGVQVTSENASAITGTGITGTVTFDASTGTLTLNNATITGTYSSAGIYADIDLKIDLIGQNTVDVDAVTNSIGIYSEKPLTFTNSTGDTSAKLFIVSSNFAVCGYFITDTGFSAKGSLSVNGVFENVAHDGLYYRIGNDFVEVLELTVASSVADYTLFLRNGKVYKNDLSGIELKGSDYGISSVGDITNGYTYTFENVDFSTSSTIGIRIYDTYNSTVVLKGENKVTAGIGAGDGTGQTYGLRAHTNLVIKGDGSITATAAGSNTLYGIYSEFPLTVESGTVTGVAGNTAANESTGINVYEDFTVTGGTVIGIGGTAAEYSYGVYIGNGDILTVTGGTLTGYSEERGITSIEIPVITGMIVLGSDSKDGTGAAEVIGWNGDNCQKIWMRIEKAPETVSVSGKVAWLDNNNQDGIRAQSVTVTLFANSADTGITAVASSATNWEFAFDKQLKYDGQAQAITYTVKPEAVSGYTAAVSGSMADGYTVTLSHTPEVTTVAGNVTWDDNNDAEGLRPVSVNVSLLANGQPVDFSVVGEGSLGDWSYSFANLPKYENGQEIIYTVEISPVTHYSASYSGYNVNMSLSHTHNWAYTAQGAVITAVCQGTGACYYKGTDFEITLNAPQKTVYGDGNSEKATITGASLAGQTALPEISYAVQGGGALSAAPTAAGKYTASVTVEGETASVNYEIAQKELTVAIEGATFTKVYDGKADAPAGLSLTLTGVVAGDTVMAEAVSYTFNAVNVANADLITANGVRLIGTDSDNYKLSGDAVTHAGTITAKELTTSIEGTTFTKVYDGKADAPAGLSIKLTGVLSGEDIWALPAQYSYNSKDVLTADTITAAGIVLDGSDAENYKLKTGHENATVAGTITPATVSPELAGQDLKTYDGTDIAHNVIVYLIGVKANDSVEAQAASYTYNSKNVKDANLITASGITLSGADKDNYVLSETSKTIAGMIESKPVTAKVSGPSTKVYDGTTAAPAGMSVVLEGTVAGDDVSATAQSYAYKEKSALYYGNAIVASGITLGGADKDNYFLALTTAEMPADITHKPVTPRFEGTFTKVYDGSRSVTDDIAKLVLDGVIPGETVQYGAQTAIRFNSEDVADASYIEVKGITLIGNGNYTLTKIDLSVAASITPKQLTADIEGTTSKVYDGTTAITGLSLKLSGVIGSDEVAASAQSYTFNTKDVATANLITANGVSLSGAHAGNYKLEDTAVKAGTITVKQLTAAIEGTTTKVYDGNANAPAGLGIKLSGIVGNEDVSASAESYTYDVKDASATTVIANNPALSGADKGNYKLPDAITVPGIIEKRQLTWNTSDLYARKFSTFPYETTVQGTLVLSGFVSGEENEVALNATGELTTEGLAVITAPGVHVVKVKAQNGYSFTPAVHVNYLMPASDPEMNATVIVLASVTYYTVKFETGGGSAVGDLTVSENGNVDLSVFASALDGYTFDGWYLDEALTQKVTTLTVTGNTTVYAGWNKVWGTNPYTDVTPDDWFYDDVMQAYEDGLMDGMGDGIFAPEITAERGMIATIIWRLEGKPVVNYINPFSDVEEEMWYTEAIRWAASQGIVLGYGDGTFGPHDTVTREQLATMLFRYAKYKGYDLSAAENTNILSYTDAFDISEYAVSAMQWTCGEQIIIGRPEGTLDPTGKAKRCEVAAVLSRFAKFTAKGK